ncbi:MAG: prolyl oligopeptidase family serine peptidase [Burkholderiaceae bacterium]
MYNIEQHIVLGRVSDLAASPCGTWLALVVQRLDQEGSKYVSDLWKVPLDGSDPTQLTRGDSKETAPRFRHDGALGFLSNRPANEFKSDEDTSKRMQVWILPAAGGEPQQLTDEPLGVIDFRFARNGDRLVAFAPVIPDVAYEKQREIALDRTKNGPSALHFTQQPVRHWDEWLHENSDLANTHLLAYEATAKGRVDLTPGARREFAIDPAVDVSADGRWAVATSQAIGKDRELDSTLVLIDLHSGAQRILGAEDNVNFESPVFSPDGGTIAAIRSTRSPTKVIRPLLTLFDIETGQPRALGAQWDRWPGAIVWNGDGTRLYFSAEDGGYVPVFGMDVERGILEQITASAHGGAHSNLQILPDGRIVGVRSTLLDAPECFIVDAQPHSTPKTLTHLSGFAGAQDWAEVESLSVPSTDGTLIHTFLIKPKRTETTPPKRLSLLFWIHGGPIGMDQDGWHWRWNPLLMVAQGYAVALPNPRGSTGFGQEFIQGFQVLGDTCEYRDHGAVHGHHRSSWVVVPGNGRREPLCRHGTFRPLRSDPTGEKLEDAGIDHPWRARLPLPDQ